MSSVKEQNSIPTGKVERAARFALTGAKLGVNYVKHYTRKLLDPEVSKEELHEANAEDIYDVLSNLKGSALKVAQMLSLDRGFLPPAYARRFALSQYNAPPLSGPLVVNTFLKTLGKTPSQLFDRFNPHAAHAASIGQVHEAWKNGKKLAVKIQYPGVAHSVKSDLRIVKPIAIRIVGLQEADMDQYFEEVETKLLEETNYRLELQRSQELSAVCNHLPNLIFPRYYPEYSSDRIITMDWLDGLHLQDFLATQPSQDLRNRAGQALWDFYQFQVHHLRKVHADPHPGNFLFQANGQVGIIDFGCVKEIPQDFYENYFALTRPELLRDEAHRRQIFRALGILHPSDTEKEIRFFTELFQKLIDLTTLPFQREIFDFGDAGFFEEIYAYTDYVYSLPEVRHSKIVRGTRHSLYVNRTYFGLYSILGDLKAQVKTSWQHIEQLKQYVPARVPSGGQLLPSECVSEG
ncbi:putative unusual protein kinase regulating ubiquinone biosynthesis (AarF/ABC1/UbiB family) [Thermoflavifilum aggregans]|uniref:Putative unusual protein kinase regulating ubiquinone biosynthesis (AarF/ABC1/UbiB family) n=1 Tax=Thermoflavifilum aggregans TaxID=454188 RepID=A0A2M9CWU7_9BACT|nr:AarF/ABC1/UbiB kinase family protein [Thermoflavifilum aggregans]PJJ76357.1 putative unusual protein kinase regulating ubiquinone biosynthesis (AarF/ABC1/UbiB family) [Thermoflavifilum aggregans]